MCKARFRLPALVVISTIGLAAIPAETMALSCSMAELICISNCGEGRLCKADCRIKREECDKRVNAPVTNANPAIQQTPQEQAGGKLLNRPSAIVNRQN